MSIVLALNVSLFHFRMVALNLGFALLSPEELLKSPAPHATPKTSQGRISGAGAQVSVFFLSSWGIFKSESVACKAVPFEAVPTISTRWHQKPSRWYQLRPKTHALCVYAQ